MNKTKKVHVDSRYNTNDRNSDSDFKTELKEALDLANNAVCYIDGVSIPHSWYTLENIISCINEIINAKEARYPINSVVSIPNSI